MLGAQENSLLLSGVTQELIDETRLSTEKNMLNDLKHLVDRNESLEFVGRSGETPVSLLWCPFSFLAKEKNLPHTGAPQSEPHMSRRCRVC